MNVLYEVAFWFRHALLFFLGTGLAVIVLGLIFGAVVVVLGGRRNEDKQKR